MNIFYGKIHQTSKKSNEAIMNRIIDKGYFFAISSFAIIGDKLLAQKRELQKFVDETHHYQCKYEVVLFIKLPKNAMKQS